MKLDGEGSCPASYADLGIDLILWNSGRTKSVMCFKLLRVLHKSFFNGFLQHSFSVPFK